MHSRITILGSGTCVPSLTRNPCSLLVQTGGAHLLFDCGPGVMRRLLEAGVSIFDISHIFLSHFHPDHTGELGSFLFALKYAPVPAHRQRPLIVVAGRGFRGFLKRLQDLYGDWVVLPSDRFSVIELDTRSSDARQFETFAVTSVPVAHGPESLAYRIRVAGGKSIVYSGDTDVCEGLATLAAAADVMICESAFPDGQKVDGHLTPSLAGAIAQAANVKTLILTHFYPACEGVDIEKQCRSAYNGKIVLAEDLMTIEL